MIKVFDSVFLNVYSFYIKKKSDMADEFATNYVSLLQGVLIALPFVFVNMFVDVWGQVSRYEESLGFSVKFVVLFFLALIMIHNHRRYKVKFRKEDYRSLKNRKVLSIPVFGLLMVIVPIALITVIALGFYFTDYLRELLFK